MDLAFNTQNVPDQTFVLESKIQIFAEDPDEKNPESMDSRLFLQLTSSLLSAYDDGSGRFLIKVDSAKYQSDKRSVEEFRHIERYVGSQDFQFKMASDGQMSALSMEEYAPVFESNDLDIRKLFLKVQPVLPSSPVKVGTSWERQHLIAGEKNSPDLFVYKWFQVEDLFVRGGITYARLKMNIKYRQESSGSAIYQMESAGFVLGSGSVVFNVSEGVLVEGVIKIDGRIRMREKIEAETDSSAIAESGLEMHVIQEISLRSIS